MLKARFFHANAIDKITKVDQQLNDFLSNIEKDDIVSVNITESGSPDLDSAYSYTIVLIYQAR